MLGKSYMGDTFVRRLNELVFAVLGLRCSRASLKLRWVGLLSSRKTRLLILRTTGSPARGRSSCGPGLNCPVACGKLPDQGSNPGVPCALAGGFSTARPRGTPSHLSEHFFTSCHCRMLQAHVAFCLPTW